MEVNQNCSMLCSTMCYIHTNVSSSYIWVLVKFRFLCVFRFSIFICVSLFFFVWFDLFVLGLVSSV